MFVNHFIFLVNIKPNSFKHIIYKNKLIKVSNKTLIDRKSIFAIKQNDMIKISIINPTTLKL